MRRTIAALLACTSTVAVTTDKASAAEDFYKGKQITFVASGMGVYDGYARVIAKHMPKYIPGNPAMVVQLMTGAAGLQAANYVYNSAPQDGTVIAATHGHIPTLPLLNPDGARFDPAKFQWLGNVTKDTFIGYVWHTAPIQSLEEAKTTEVLMGGQAVGSMSIDMAILAKEMFGLKFKIVTGYSGANEVKLALEKGEISGQFGNALTSLKTSNPDWIPDKKVTIVTQFGFKRHKELQDVPLFIDLATKPEDRQVLELMLARQETAKPYYVGPGVPADRVAILRSAFDKTMIDAPDFLADMAKQRFDVDEPMGWQEVTALVGHLQETPPSVAKSLTGYFDKFRESKN